MDGNKLTLYDKNKRLLMKVERSKNRLYSIKLQIEAPICLLANVDNQAWLWHARLGHLNFDDINKMTRKNLVEGIPRINHAGQICDACLLGKHSRTPFPNLAKFRSKNPLDLVYGDLCGPISPATHSGKKLIFLKNGIARQLTAPYSPQQNRVVERRNRTVLSTTRSMMKAMKLPLTFWAKATRHAIHILNRVPTRALEDKTPYEALYNRKPNLENLRIFRCTAYAKITTPHLKKLDDRSIPLIYLEIEEGSKACRLYDPVAKKKYVRRDVRFMETKPWNWDKDEVDTSTQDTFWTNFVIEGVDNKINTLVNTNINGDDDNTYQEPDTIPDPVSPITPPTYTYNPHSDEEVKATISSIENSEKEFDHVPVRGFKKLTDIYQNTQEVKTNTLLLTKEEPLNQKAIGLKWVFKTKRDAKGNIIKYKARLVAKGYVQEQGINFDEVFALVERIETVRLILALAAYHGWQVHHLDVKSSFLHEDLKEEVYVTQPEGFVQPRNSGKTGGEITIKQTGYITKILKETSMMDSNDAKIPMDPGTKLVKTEDGNSIDATYYKSLIGSLRYLLHTRPDLSYSAGLLSRFMQDPKDHHLKAVKQVIQYIKGTKEHGIIYKKEGGCKITRSSDSSYGINTDQGKGTIGIVFYFGESPITWCTQKQPTVALSSCESEFMAATAAACQFSNSTCQEPSFSWKKQAH
nr:zinc finger, CCHC-type [Tanacetum cinerariifolium]